jgi:hypothetical protein
MLGKVLQTIKMSQKPISLAALSQDLKIERSALEGMLAYWVQKGRIKVEDQNNETPGYTCASGSCGPTCSGADNCVFMAKMPKVYKITDQEDPSKQP